MLLDAAERAIVEEAVRGVCDHRGWFLTAVHVRTNHVHAVTAAAASPERIMSDFKSWSTRRLREAGLVGADTRVWSRHGSTRYLWDEASVERAAHYVVEGQGVDLD